MYFCSSLQTYEFFSQLGFSCSFHAALKAFRRFANNEESEPREESEQREESEHNEEPKEEMVTRRSERIQIKKRATKRAAKKAEKMKKKAEKEKSKCELNPVDKEPEPVHQKDIAIPSMSQGHNESLSKSKLNSVEQKPEFDWQENIVIPSTSQGHKESLPPSAPPDNENESLTHSPVHKPKRKKLVCEADQQPTPSTSFAHKRHRESSDSDESDSSKNVHVKRASCPKKQKVKTMINDSKPFMNDDFLSDEGDSPAASNENDFHLLNSNVRTQHTSSKTESAEFERYVESEIVDRAETLYNTDEVGLTQFPWMLDDFG